MSKLTQGGWVFVVCISATVSTQLWQLHIEGRLAGVPKEKKKVAELDIKSVSHP